MPCTISIDADIKGTLPGPSVTIRGTATCDEVKVYLTCNPTIGPFESDPITVTGGEWSVTFDDAGNFGCACDGLVTVRAECMDDPTCFSELPPTPISCHEEECPEIVSIAVEIGDCEVDPLDGKTKRRVYFYPTVLGVPTSYKWTWGDTTSDPMKPWATFLSPCEHLYESAPTSEPEFEIFGPYPPCGSHIKSVPLSEFAAFEPCGCPEITDIAVEIGDCVLEDGVLKREVIFTPTVTDPEPDVWEWSFGDSTSDFGSWPPTTDDSTHGYVTAPADPPEFCIKGPDSCPKVCRDVPLSEFEAFEPCEPPSPVGACCLPDGNCEELAEDECDELGGIYYGDGTTCEVMNPIGACCLPDDTCEEMTKCECLRQGGEYMGDETTCDEVDCHRTGKMCFDPLLAIIVLLGLAAVWAITALVVSLCRKIPVPDWALAAAMGAAVAAFALILLWQMLCLFKLNDERCCPNRCDLLLLPWIVLINAALIAAYLAGCCGTEWLVLTIVLFVLALSAFLVWLRECKPTRCEVIGYLTLAIVTVAGTIWTVFELGPVETILGMCYVGWVKSVLSLIAVILGIASATCILTPKDEASM